MKVLREDSAKNLKQATFVANEISILRALGMSCQDIVNGIPVW